MRPHFLSVLSAVGYAFPLIEGAAYSARAPQPVPDGEPPLPEGTPAAYNRQIPPIPGMTAAGSPADADAEFAVDMFGFPAPFDQEFLLMIRPERPSESPQPNASGRRLESEPKRETRSERLERIKREIALGVYDTPERFDAAVDRMLEKLYA